MRPLKKIIHLDALRHNWALLDKKSATSTMIAVVKADAYGHGVRNVLPALKNAAAYAVACIEEALELRRHNVQQPIILLEGIFAPAEVRLCSEYHIEPVIHNQRQLAWLKENAAQTPVKAWLKIDSGMHRLGFRASVDAQQIIDAVSTLPQIDWQGTVSHFACADSENLAHARGQLAALDALKLPAGWQRCYANSAAIFHLPQALYEYCRPGLVIYGMSPFEFGTGADLGLRPAMTLQSEVLAVHYLQKGETAGYGQGFTAPADGYLATIAGGYGDGLARAIPSGKVPVLVGGKPYYLVGRVAMDMSLVWLGNDAVEAGEKVIFWGVDLPAEDVARAANTIPYTLTTMLTKRVATEVVDG